MMNQQETRTQVADLTAQLAGPDVPGESYLEKVGRVNNARSRASEIVMADEPRPVDQDDWEHRFEIWQGGHPIRVLLREFHRTMNELDEQWPEADDLTAWKRDRLLTMTQLRQDLEELDVPLPLINQCLTPATGDAEVVMDLWVTSLQTDQALQAWMRPQWEALAIETREDAWDAPSDGADYYQATQRVAQGLPRF